MLTIMAADRDRALRLAAKIGLSGEISGLIARERDEEVGWLLTAADGAQYQDLREALERLQLNDASLTFEPETSAALGFGFRGRHNISNSVAAAAAASLLGASPEQIAKGLLHFGGAAAVMLPASSTSTVVSSI